MLSRGNNQDSIIKYQTNPKYPKVSKSSTPWVHRRRARYLSTVESISLPTSRTIFWVPKYKRPRIAKIAIPIYRLADHCEQSEDIRWIPAFAGTTTGKDTFVPLKTRLSMIAISDCHTMNGSQCQCGAFLIGLAPGFIPSRWKSGSSRFTIAAGYRLLSVWEQNNEAIETSRWIFRNPVERRLN